MPVNAGSAARIPPLSPTTGRKSLIVGLLFSGLAVILLLTGELLFQILGIVLAAAFIGFSLYVRAGSSKFGHSFLEVDQTPVPVGGRLSGRVVIPRNVPPGARLKVMLTCIQDSGPSMPLELHRVVAVSDPAAQHAQGVSAAFTVDVPADGPPTGPQGSARMEWKLSATAEQPGLDYFEEFGVPIVANQ